jgi:hypothetical protein
MAFPSFEKSHFLGINPAHSFSLPWGGGSIDAPASLPVTTGIYKVIVDYLASDAVRSSFGGDFHPDDPYLAEHMQLTVFTIWLMSRYGERALPCFAGYKPCVGNAVEAVTADVVSGRLHRCRRARQRKRKRPMQLGTRPFAAIHHSGFHGYFSHLHVRRKLMNW